MKAVGRDMFVYPIIASHIMILPGQTREILYNWSSFTFGSEEDARPWKDFIAPGHHAVLVFGFPEGEVSRGFSLRTSIFHMNFHENGVYVKIEKVREPKSGSVAITFSGISRCKI